jgi:hypothetical protein
MQVHKKEFPQDNIITDNQTVTKRMTWVITHYAKHGQDGPGINTLIFLLGTIIKICEN